MASPEQRVELVKSESRRIQQYLGLLSAEDLARPSACDAGEVRDVVAHLIGGIDLFAANTVLLVITAIDQYQCFF